MIVYLQEIVDEMRAVVKRIDDANFFCYNNGRRVRDTDRELVRGCLLDSAKLVDKIRPPKRTQDKFEG